jgi:hypothetical protein
MDTHERMFKHLELEDRRDLESGKARRDWISIIVAGLAAAISVLAAYDAHKSADIAAESLKVQIKSMETSQRAYIGVENPSIRSGQAILKLKVYGNSPAKIISVNTSCEFSHFPPSAHNQGGGGGDIPEGEREVLNPGSIRLLSCRPQKGPSKILSRILTFKGEIVYRDLFEKQHQTSYCFFSMIGSPNVEPCEIENNVD